MNLTEELIQLFRSYEDVEQPVRVTFRAGDAYDLEILSADHAEAGGDIVADVVQVIRPSEPPFDWSDAAMNFKLDDVLTVECGGQRLFERTA